MNWRISIGMLSAAAVAALAAGLTMAQAAPPAVSTILPGDARIQWIGRVDDRDAGKPRIAYPGTEIRLRFEGGSIHLAITADSGMSALTVVLDHGAPEMRLLQKGANDVAITALPADGRHDLQIVKRTETWQGVLTLENVTLPEGTTLLAPLPRPARKLMFVGDSVTCGAGVNNNAKCTQDPANPANDVYDSYGLLLGRRLDAETHLVCFGGRGLVRDYRGLGAADNVVNAPQFFLLSVPNPPAEGGAPWNAQRWQPDAIFFSLGTNDMNLEKTKPLDEAAWVATYVSFLKTARELYPKAPFFLTEGAIVTDPLLREMVQKAAAASGDPLVHYVASQHYPGNGCDGHPTRAQHVQMADDFEPVFRSTLGW